MEIYEIGSNLIGTSTVIDDFVKFSSESRTHVFVFADPDLYGMPFCTCVESRIPGFLPGQGQEIRLALKWFDKIAPGYIFNCPFNVLFLY